MIVREKSSGLAGWLDGYLRSDKLGTERRSFTDREINKYSSRIDTIW